MSAADAVIAELQPPAWVADRLSDAEPSHRRDGSLRIEGWVADDWALLTVRRDAARQLAPEALTAATVEAYAALQRVLAEDALADLRPVRMWNGIPDLQRRDADGQDRYMRFNAGRCQACRDWLPLELLPTATGVGHGGDDLLVHCLATRHPARAVENPRQISAYRYSRRYGPQPPCFARATRVDEPERCNLFIGGTASVLGEDSVHVGDREAQVAETLRNLAAVIAAADGRGLAALTSLRVYHPRPEDRAAIAAELQAAGIRLAIDWQPAPLCRPELLVEVEGVADLERVP